MQINYEALGLVMESINSRFNQQGYEVYRIVENCVLNARHVCAYDTELSISTGMISPKCNCKRNFLSFKLCLLN